MSETATARRDDRVDVRLSTETKALIARAASYAGMTVSSFLVAVARERAKELVAERESVILSPRDWTSFIAALDRPLKRRPKLAAAATRFLKHRDRVR